MSVLAFLRSRGPLLSIAVICLLLLAVVLGTFRSRGSRPPRRDREDRTPPPFV